MGLFGMMNWLYTWHQPRLDPDAAVLAQQISDIFLRGVRSDGRSVVGRRKQPRGKAGRS
jgi:hypothetical protein